MIDPDTELPDEPREGEDGAPVATIGEIAREFGLSPRTLRFYEARGLLSPRREAGARVYGPLERARLRMIVRAKTFGLPLAEIAAMLERGEEPSAQAGPTLSLVMVEQQLRLLEERQQAIEAGLKELRSLRTRLLRGEGDDPA
jgi:DNA-binding transcriptional MerR regulator